MNVIPSSSPIRVMERRYTEKQFEFKKSLCSSKQIVNIAVSDSKSNQMEKIKGIFQSEFEETIENIMLEDSDIYLGNLEERVRRNLFEMAQQDENLKKKFETSEFNDSIIECATVFKNEVYSPNYKFLSNTLENLESKIKNPQGKRTISVSRNIEIVTFLKKFKKHCAKTKEAYHTCRDRLIEIYVDSSREQPNYFICLSCKKVYTCSQILLSCEECDTEYHTCYDTSEDIEIQPATWEKYHCDAIVNDHMRCIKCKETFYLNCNTGNLECRNENCRITVNPNTLSWRCMFCKEEFTSNAKVYNPLEFKNIKKSIKEALLKKIPATPQVRPCCANSNQDSGEKSANYSSSNVIKSRNLPFEYFKHKKECDGNLFLGSLSKKQIVVCEKCKSMNFYERFVWTCPVCFKRFRQKISNSQNKQHNNNRTPTRVSHSNYNSICNSSNNIDFNSNFNLNKSPIVISEDNTKDGKNIKKPPKFELKAVNIKTADKGLENSPKIKKESEGKIDISKFNSEIKRANSFSEKDDDKDIQNNEIKKNLFKEFKADDQDSSKVNITNINLINIINLNNNSDNKSIINKLKATPDLREITRNLNLSKPQEVVSETSNLKNLNKNEAAKPKEIEERKMSPPNFKRKSSQNIKSVKEEAKQTQINFNLNLEDFDIIKQIGEGSFGIIYSVMNKFTKESYAMKKIIAHSEKEVKLFKQEYELMNSITEQYNNKYCKLHVLKIIGTDIKKLDSTTFALYVFSELANTDWEKEINNRNEIKKFYKEEELMDILKIAVKTLAEMQKENISHRDIKPQNILIFNKENLIYKIADFGEAKELKLNKQQLNTLRGTELYMSPILFFSLRNKTDNSSKINHNPFKSDLFSLGLCMLFASTLTFKSLYDIRELQDTKSISAIVNRYLKGRYSTKFLEYLMAMLEFNETKRCDFIEMEEFLSY